MSRLSPASLIVAGILATAPASAAERLAGYAEFRHGDVLVVDGQRIRADASTRMHGASSFDRIPLGAEVSVTGTRDADGAVLARDVTATTNGHAWFEHDVVEASDQLERLWIDRGEMYEEDANGRERPIGRLVDRGPEVARVERILARLVPAYVDGRRIRVHVVDSADWNAAALGNGAVWVYTGLLEAMNDDELAVVLGHELAHYTHEHARREMRRGLWTSLIASGAMAAAESIDSEAVRAVAVVGALAGLNSLTAGYSRDLEDQADRVGLRYAFEAGYDVRAGRSLWTKFLQKYGQQSRLANVLAGSHSRPSDRIRNVAREIARNYGG